MEAVSEVILRNADRLDDSGTVLLNPAPDSLGRALTSKGLALRASTTHHGVFRQLGALGLDTRFEAVPTLSGFDRQFLMVLPREKDLLRMQLHCIAAGLPADGTLWLVGENRSGIKSSARHLRDFFSAVTKIDNARHCVLFAARQARQAAPFSIDDYVQRWRGGEDKTSPELLSMPGVFSHGRLDRGTAVLLDTLNGRPVTGRVMDFACGSGIIGLSLLANATELDLTLLDVSALALESARRSLELNGRSARLLASDGLAEAQGSFDFIVSNPPFHRGVKNDLGTAAGFFRRVGTFLAEKGRIRVVFNQHLPYHGWMQDSFKSVETLARRDGFDVVQASNPR